MKLVVNGAEIEVDDRHAKTPLLWVLRDVLGLHGTKFGCGAGFCAACTVLIDGRNTKSCQTATERAVGKSVTTVEGASGPVVDAVRDAWHRGNVVQCGYCQPGQTLAAVSLLEADASPDDAKIDEWMSGNLCRCGTYPRIRAAIHEAAGTLASGHDPDPLVAPAEPEIRRLTPEEMADPVHPYIRIHEDGTIVAYSSQIEMGQGIHTGLATIVAEELDADFDSVRVVNAANGGGPPQDVYGNPDAGSAFQYTGASSSTRAFWVRYPLVAAQARARLAAAAAELWDVPADEVEFERGVVRHASGREATFGQLAARAEQLPVPDGVQPKDRSDYTLIGRRRAVARRLRAEDPRRHPLHDRLQRPRNADGGCAPPAAVRRDGRVGRRRGGPRRARCHGRRDDRGGRRRRRRNGRRRAAWVAGPDGGVGRLARRAPQLAGTARRARSVVGIRRAGGRGPGRRRREAGVDERADGHRRDVRVAIPRARGDGAEQRRVPDARRRRARGVGEHRVARVDADFSLGGGRDRRRSRSRFTSPSRGDRSGCTRRQGATPCPRPCTSLARSTGSTRSKSSRCARRTSRSVATARWPCTGCGPEPTQTAGSRRTTTRSWRNRRR